MKTEDNKFELIKKVMIDGMVRNFKNDGFLSPLIFFSVGTQLELSNVPQELLSDDLGKSILGGVIRTKCCEPDTTVAGMIFEAYGKKLYEEDNELKDSLLNGEVRVSELDEKQDLIVMIISSPEKQEVITFNVDPETKTVDELLDGNETDGLGGTFSEFFNWEK